jgi:hypothetical protein
VHLYSTYSGHNITAPAGFESSNGLGITNLVSTVPRYIIIYP